MATFTLAGSPFEFDTTFARLCRIVPIDSTHFLFFYEDSSGNGIARIAVLSSDTFAWAGAPRTVQSGNFGNASFHQSQDALLIDSTHVLFAWRGDDTTLAQVATIDGSWDMSLEGSPAQILDNGGAPAIVRAGASGAVVAHQHAAQDGGIAYVTWDGSYNVTVEEEDEYDTNQGTFNSIHKVNDDATLFFVTSEGPGNDGWAYGFELTGTPTLDIVDSHEFDGTNASPVFSVPLDGTHFLVFWNRSGTGAFARTLSCDASADNLGAVGSGDFAVLGADVAHIRACVLDEDDDYWYVVLIYSEAATQDAWIDAVRVSKSTYTIDQDVAWDSAFEFESTFGLYIDICKINTTQVGLVWQDADSDGQSRAVDIDLGLAGATEVAVGLATEADSTLALTANKSQEAGLPTEADSALAASIAREYLLGLAGESGVAPGVTSLKAIVLGLSGETDAALAAAAAKALAADLAGEADSALASSVLRSLAVGLPGESDLGLALSAAKLLQVGLAGEADSALGASALTAALHDLEGYRFRADDGDEDEATWLDDQDTDVTRPKGVPFRLRTLVNTSGGDPDSEAATLQYRKSGDPEWTTIGSA